MWSLAVITPYTTRLGRRSTGASMHCRIAFWGWPLRAPETSQVRNLGNFPGFNSRARHVSTRQAQTTEPLRQLTVRSPNCRRGLPAAARSASYSRGRCSLRTPQTRAAPRAAATRRRAALGVSPDFTQRLRRGFDRPPRRVRGLSKFYQWPSRCHLVSPLGAALIHSPRWQLNHSVFHRSRTTRSSRQCTASHPSCPRCSAASSPDLMPGQLLNVT
jgi:hypothetical protein